MIKRIAISISFTLALAGLLYLVVPRNESESASIVIPKPTTLRQLAERLPDKLISRTTVGSATEKDGQEVSNNTVDPKFRTWLEQEAKALDLPSVNGEQKRKEMLAKAKSLTPEQSRHLRETAIAPGPAGPRILSTYLLVEGGRLTQEDLRQAIQAPLEDRGPMPPHSENEIKNMQDKSLRIMAIDGLASRAKSDPSAKKALAQAAQESADPYIRNYAKEKLEQTP